MPSRKSDFFGLCHEDYKKWRPPQTLRRKSLWPVQVNISLTILRIISIEEEGHSIELQFQINLVWKEYRVTYYNLKKDLHLNTLSAHQMNSLWLPLVIYTNTKQLESTRLSVDWEWTTNIWIRRETPEILGDELDETEIFKGSENSLVMVQSYTHEFQCTFQLQHYPFDTQVSNSQNYKILIENYELYLKSQVTIKDNHSNHFLRLHFINKTLLP